MLDDPPFWALFHAQMRSQYVDWLLLVFDRLVMVVDVLYPKCRRF